MSILDEAFELKEYMVEQRNYFHSHPELGLQEFNTCNRIEEELNKKLANHQKELEIKDNKAEIENIPQPYSYNPIGTNNTSESKIKKNTNQIKDNTFKNCSCFSLICSIDGFDTFLKNLSYIHHISHKFRYILCPFSVPCFDCSSLHF